MSYGKHQSFFLKKNWLNKAFNSFDRDGMEIFYDYNNFRNLGIGKNMFQSLRYWLEATGIVTPNNGHHIYTPLGKLIHDFDRGCNKMSTMNLLHYNLCTMKIDNEPFSHAFYWFFNNCEEILFRKDIIKQSLKNWSDLNNARSISESTISRDIDCLLNSYIQKRPDHPEDKNIALFSSLELIKISDNSFVKVGIDKKKLSLDVCMYILIEMHSRDKILTIERLVNGKRGLGKIFCLNRLEIIEILEEMVKLNYNISITRTNNLDIVQLLGVIPNSFEFIEERYRGYA